MTTYGKMKEVTTVGASYKAKDVVALVIGAFPETNKTSILPSDVVVGSKYLGKKNEPLFTKENGTYTRI